jgi:uncharacterized protein YndB with AHSA1/START domain
MGYANADRIEKSIELNAELSRVWRALTDYREFGEWFRVKLERPFVTGRIVRGNMQYPGYEHLMIEVLVREMVPQRAFSFEWHPHAMDPKLDYSTEKRTLVEFQLEERPVGASLTVRESGFGGIPEARRQRAHQMNSQGWEIQLKNNQEYLANNP